MNNQQQSQPATMRQPNAEPVSAVFKLKLTEGTSSMADLYVIDALARAATWLSKTDASIPTTALTDDSMHPESHWACWVTT